MERGATAFRRYGVDAFYYFGFISLEGYRFEMRATRDERGR